MAILTKLYRQNKKTEDREGTQLFTKKSLNGGSV